MQRREAYGRKAATQALVVIAESIRASRGRRSGKETPNLSRDSSMVEKPNQLLSQSGIQPKDEELGEGALVKREQENSKRDTRGKK